MIVDCGLRIADLAGQRDKEGHSEFRIADVKGADVREDIADCRLRIADLKGDQVKEDVAGFENGLPTRLPRRLRLLAMTIKCFKVLIDHSCLKKSAIRNPQSAIHPLEIS